MYYFFAILIGYFIGSIPFSLILGKKFHDTDIREHGSGNLGASNAGRILGKKMGISVLILDILKCTISVLITFLLLKYSINIESYNTFIYLTGIFTLVGHSFPLFASLKGGKAVASSFGFLLITNPYLFLIAITLFLVSLKIFKMISVSSMSSLLIVALISFIPIFNTSLFLKINLDLTYSLVLLGISLFIIIRHHSNIKRIINKKENKINWF